MTRELDGQDEALDPHEGVWFALAEPDASAWMAGRSALFLDRDGVVVEDIGYLHRPRDVRLISGIASLLAAANTARLPCILVTNQSGIGRGLYDWSAFRATQERIAALLALAEPPARLDAVLACPFHAEGRPPYRHPAHPCRKPRPGMLLWAAERLRLDLAHSWILGDRAIDLAAGKAAGLAGGMLLASGPDAPEATAAEALDDVGFTFCRIADLAEAEARVVRISGG